LSILLALVSALGFGASDFLAGLMSRRGSVFMVTLFAQAASASITWVVLAFTGAGPQAGVFAWGCAGGAGAWLGTLFLYRGLARGTMSVVGPLSAVFTAAGGAIVGIALGDRLSALGIAGILCACAAVGLVSLERRDPRSPRRPARSGVLDAALAGAGFTVLFVALKRAGDGAGLWPVAMSQSMGLVLAFAFTMLLAARGRVSLRASRGVWSGAAPAGLLGGGATIAYFYAAQLGLLSVAAVLTSLYPAGTVALAVAVLRERLRRVQALGLGLAALAVALLASGA
jgi:drug/metabolite transporter (DMT)-like permease